MVLLNEVNISMFESGPIRVKKVIWVVYSLNTARLDGQVPLYSVSA